jgi:arylsulfatase A-like enzyme
VPFLARWPGRIEAGSKCDQTISLTDLLATCSAIVGRKTADNAGEDSFNILPYLLAAGLERPIREATVHHSMRGVFAIRQQPWKLILGRGSGGFTQPARVEPAPGQPEGQLYNLSEVPGETTNLWKRHPEVVARMTRLLERYKNAGRSAP